MSDIARELGISTVSVSKALNGKDGVSDSLRKTIVKKANELGYRCVDYSKGSEKNHHNIGIIISEHFLTKDMFYSRLYEKTMMKTCLRTLSFPTVFSDPVSLHTI